MLINILEYFDIQCMEGKNDDKKYFGITLLGNEVVWIRFYYKMYIMLYPFHESYCIDLNIILNNNLSIQNLSSEVLIDQYIFY